MKEKSCGCLTCKKGCLCGPYAKFFDALGNVSRIHIVNALRERSKNVTEIMKETGLEQTCVSHCLRTLQKRGFVTSEKDGKYRIYTLNNLTVEPLMKLIDVHVNKYCKT